MTEEVEVTEYRARIIDETGYSYECWWFTGDLSEYHARNCAWRHVRSGGTALVERVTYTFCKDDKRKAKPQSRNEQVVWTGGDQARLRAHKAWERKEREESNGGAA